MSVITVADVRDDMYDRQAEDHLVLADLAFTDADIEWGMKSCARKFNSVRPVEISVAWDALPADTSVFFDGVAWALLRRWLRNVSLNDYNYTAGGVQANVQGSLRANLERLVLKLEQEFVDSATNLKVTSNLNDAWGPIG